MQLSPINQQAADLTVVITNVISCVFQSWQITAIAVEVYALLSNKSRSVMQ
jgi:hypothetical protein